MNPDTLILIVVLSSVFSLLFAVFLFLILRFTFRNRTLEPRSTSPDGHQTQATMQQRTQQWKDRWSAKRRGDAAVVSGADEDEVEAQGEHVDDRTAGEFGATVHADGTRSYLNGWSVHFHFNVCC